MRQQVLEVLVKVLFLETLMPKCELINGHSLHGLTDRLVVVELLALGAPPRHHTDGLVLVIVNTLLADYHLAGVALVRSDRDAFADYALKVLKNVVNGLDFLLVEVRPSNLWIDDRVVETTQMG